MSQTKYALGLDFGTESGRAVVVDVGSGQTVGSATYRYADGVIDEKLPGTSIRLGPDWALQNPADYLATLKQAVPEALKVAGVQADYVIGIGIDFTACTILPTRADGTPLCFEAEWKGNPHAWTKLWKHHAAQPEADRINAVAVERGEAWLPLYGGRISSEWLHSKTLQILDESPDVYTAMDRIVEAGDWVVWQMTGVEKRNACAAGYKGMWNKATGYPSNDFLRALDPRLDGFHQTKAAGEVVAPGARVGHLTRQAAAWMGLRHGIAVAAPTIDAHAAVPGAGVTTPGRMALILGTSTCHMIVDEEQHLVPGISGVVGDGIIPGLYGYEGGQAGVGDIFEWFVENAVPGWYERRAAEAGLSVYQALERDAAQQRPGEAGLIALDWWNGNRSVLVNAGLSGLLIGMTLGTRPPDIFRALIEATAFGTRIIVDTFEQNGVRVKELVACGGLAERNKLLLQIYADVTGREFVVGGTGQASALGAAMLGALAAGRQAGGFDSLTKAAQSMVADTGETYRPNAAHHKVYQSLFADYQRLHDTFGRGENDVMLRLRELRHQGV